MKIRLIGIGKTTDPNLIALCSEFENRLKHYCQFEVEYHSSKLKTNERELVKTEEGKLLLAKILPSNQVILLDNRGSQYGSEEFSQFLQKRLNAASQDIVFLIGGAFGFSEAVYERANFKLSLSKMTFTHQLIRVIFTEQLYRAFTILKGEKYHH